MKAIKIIAVAIFLIGLFVFLALPDSSQSIETNNTLTNIGFWLIMLPSFVLIFDAISKRKNVS